MSESDFDYAKASRSVFGVQYAVSCKRAHGLQMHHSNLARGHHVTWAIVTATAAAAFSGLIAWRRVRLIRRPTDTPLIVLLLVVSVTILMALCAVLLVG